MAAAERGAGTELTVDRIRCDGRGLCAELLPELVRLDDWGYPIVAPEPIPDHLMGHARRATAACPVLALALRRSQHAPGRLPANSKQRAPA